MEVVGHEPTWTTEFERLSHMPDDDIDLAVAALLIAQSEYPDLEGRVRAGGPGRTWLRSPAGA